MKAYFKIILCQCVRVVFHIFHVFPIKQNRIFLDSFKGTAFSCNPKYIFMYLYSLYGDKLEYIWNLPSINAIENFENVKIVKRSSLKYFYYILTSKVYIVNVSIHCYTPFRRSQIVINTWHGGGAYKQVGNSDGDTNLFENFSAKLTSEKYLTYFVSSSQTFTKVMANSFYIPIDKFLPIGMPRNDCFFRDFSYIRTRTRNSLKLSDDIGIVLYAPTYRQYKDQVFLLDLDMKYVLEALAERFDKPFIGLFRGHHCMSHSFVSDIIDVTSYPDMQELLCAVDVLITDYSSSIWDYSFTYKPCFIYAPDIDLFNEGQGLYTSIDHWPFSWAKNNQQMVENILTFDNEKYYQSLDRHHSDFGNYERGTASKVICDLISEQIRLRE